MSAGIVATSPPDSASKICSASGPGAATRIRPSASLPTASTLGAAIADLPLLSRGRIVRHQRVAGTQQKLTVGQPGELADIFLTAKDSRREAGGVRRLETDGW